MNVGIFSNMIQFMYNKCSTHPVRGKRPHFQKFGPCYLLLLASVLILADLVRHLLNDAWGSHCDAREDVVAPPPSAASSAANINSPRLLLLHAEPELWAPDASLLHDTPGVDDAYEAVRSDFSSNNGTFPDVPEKYTEFCYSTGYAAMYGKGGHLNFLGIFFSVICTWTGFVLLFGGVFWGIDLHRKIRLQWNRIRGQGGNPRERGRGEALLEGGRQV
mmetsp:Transcript_18629/g.46503  ORF Transcript_18629/g.46503 Transcript_18629/m.46503 type:complete len:218 (+) Transcript_18629:674-1327(+)|eukprot:g15462.t1